MSPRNLKFKCAIVTGGGGGIGFALSKWLIAQAKKVIIVCRTDSKLQTASKELGHSIPYYTLNTSDIPSIPSFIEKVTEDHPEVDCLINNAPSTSTTSTSKQPTKKSTSTSTSAAPCTSPSASSPTLNPKSFALIVNVSSVLGYIPTSVIRSVYNGTKVWTHFWSMNIRTQLKDMSVRVVEIAPLTVSTDLHRERSDPDDDKEKNSAALSVEEFMDFVTKDWKADKEVIGAGTS
ncbi:hypothetical protein OEA41_003591 [Lepraria neglecta]|uniref:NAD(P)-binding protein n=1 Tax=Lepraria neglecta TaxID=209136 RepID=A0AAE0DII6_9LECA|nr:hypothetical protein OEA41_003591 [Lepraria neglecta]